MRDVQVMRVHTQRGEATLILDGGIVEHASPSMCWALGLHDATLRRLLAAREDIVDAGPRRAIRPIHRRGKLQYTSE